MAREGQGSFCPTAKYADTIIAGDDLLAVDVATVRYRGLDPMQVKYLRYFLEEKPISYGDFSVYEGGVGGRRRSCRLLQKRKQVH